MGWGQTSSAWGDVVSALAGGADGTGASGRLALLNGSSSHSPTATDTRFCSISVRAMSDVDCAQATGEAAASGPARRIQTCALWLDAVAVRSAARRV
jgi:hypothetical protein